MALVVGTIRSAGQGVAGLLVKAFEEIRVGFDLDDGKPCRFSSPNVRQIGQGGTDAGGNFSISYTPRERPEESCGFTATVRVTVFDGAVLVFQSPKKTRTATTRFDFDILPPTPPPGDGERRARIVGTLTRCGEPAVGHRIVAVEEVRVGVPLPPKPCRMSSPSIRRIGTAVVDAEGKFEIVYTPTPEPEDEDVCSFIQTVRIAAFDGAVTVFQSPDRRFSPTVRFDHELYPECVSGSTLVRVVDESGRRVRGAEIFADGASRGVTDGVGHLFVPGVVAGSTLVARLRVLEHETDRASHSVDSDQNWNYRVYVTSATLLHDRNGDDPRFEMHTVADPAAVQDLVVRRRNTIVGFNLIVSVEWDATAEQMLFFRDRMLETSELLFNGTDGQFLIERVSVLDNGSGWGDADFRVFADWNQGSNATVGGIEGKSGVIRMNPFDMLFPGMVLHEFGHYGFHVRDEYKAADCWPDDEPVLCTLQADDPGTEFSEGAGRDACFMRGAQFQSRKKLCSSHPANPHVRCTAQGDEDCWSVVAQRYGGSSAWRLQTPAGRGAIVDRLPDSGVPLGGGGTTPPPSADRADSYIPVAGWKPSWHVRLVPLPGECPDLIARVIARGAPVDDARVTLRTSGGRSILQGRTGANNLPDGVVTGPGEIALRGAHIGDSVNASVKIGRLSIGRTVEITSCTSPLVIDLSLGSGFLPFRTVLAAAGGVGLTIGGPPSAPLAPPTISVLHEGEQEPFVIDGLVAASAAGNALVMTSDEDQDAYLEMASFDAEGNEVLTGCRIAQRQLVADEPRTLTSATGELELVVARGAIECPARVVIEDAIDVPAPPLEKGDALLVAPQRVASSRGALLAAPALLHLNAAGVAMDYGRAGAASMELLAYDAAARAWHAMPARLHPRPPTATASIDRLGIFALVRRGQA